MQKINLTLAAVALSLATTSSCAAQPQLGANVEGGSFLYRQKVEMYWNDWIAYPLMDKATLPTAGQARATVIGEGKTVSFIGNVSINCENGQYYWESAGSDSEFLTAEEQVDSIVPEPVISNAVKLFCK